MSNNKEAKVVECRGSLEDGGDWVFPWRMNLFVWELLISLMEDLDGHR